MENTAESTFNPISQGCGTHPKIAIRISPTTGGDFHVNVDPNITIDDLKKIISKRLKLNRDRICLLFRNKQLQDGKLIPHGVGDGSKIILLPNVEAGLVQQKSESGILQALESLNDTQVNEFLCGKAPLNLSMRLGDHVMLIQLQLSTVLNVKPRPVSKPTPTIRPATLTQASRNLQHTLRRFSSDVFSTRGNSTRRRGSVYSGTFTGALNPALQDPKGRIRKDVATIVHILNDLLCSAPELKCVSNPGEDQLAVPQENRGASTSTISDDHIRTQGKMEQLRLVMDERRQRRHQRKRKPYSIPPSDNTDTVTA